MKGRAKFVLAIATLGLTACAAGQVAGPDLSEYTAAGMAVQQARVDLNADGRDEVIAHVTGRDVCGSGGCLTLVFTPEGEGYRQIMRATVSRMPIGVATTLSNGWSDLVVGIRGGGIGNDRSVMAFDGTAYPSNPTVPPARPAASGMTETIVIAAE